MRAYPPPDLPVPPAQLISPFLHETPRPLPLRLPGPSPCAADACAPTTPRRAAAETVRTGNRDTCSPAFGTIPCSNAACTGTCYGMKSDIEPRMTRGTGLLPGQGGARLRGSEGGTSRSWLGRAKPGASAQFDFALESSASKRRRH